MSDYFVSINGGARARLDLQKVTSFTREQNSLASSWLKIGTTEDFTAAAEWTLGAKFELFLGPAQRLFCGTLVDPTNSAQAAGQGRRYLVECPWREFRRTPFEQASRLYLNAGISPTDQLTSWAALWAAGRASDTVAEVCDYLIADQADFPSLLPVAWLKGAIDAEIPMRPSKISGANCSEVIQRSMQFLRDAVSWWDWSGALPKFNLRTAVNMDVVTLPFGGQGSGAVKWEVQRSTEQQLRYVKIVLLSQLPVSSTFNQINRTTIAPAGYSGPKEGGLSTVFSLPETWDILQAGAFAQAIYDSSQNIGWIGSVTVEGVDIDTRLRPGVKVNQSGGNGDYASMNAIVQRTMDDLKSGTTTAVFTPPRVLTVQALQAMLRKMWPAISSSELTAQHTGQNPTNSYGSRKDHNDPSSKGNGSDLTGSMPHVFYMMENQAGAPTPVTSVISSVDS